MVVIIIVTILTVAIGLTLTSVAGRSRRSVERDLSELPGADFDQIRANYDWAMSHGTWPPPSRPILVSRGRMRGTHRVAA